MNARPNALTGTERDALARIRKCARRGWSCRLRYHHVAALYDAREWWLTMGLPGPAAVRIRAAHRDVRGVRLTVDECRDVVEAFEAAEADV